MRRRRESSSCYNQFSRKSFVVFSCSLLYLYVCGSMAFSVLNLIFLIYFVTMENRLEFHFREHKQLKLYRAKKVFSYEAYQNQKFHSLLPLPGALSLQSIVNTSSTFATKLLMCFFIFNFFMSFHVLFVFIFTYNKHIS